jgi:hypothetical protein
MQPPRVGQFGTAEGMARQEKASRIARSVINDISVPAGHFASFGLSRAPETDLSKVKTLFEPGLIPGSSTEKVLVREVSDLGAVSPIPSADLAYRPGDQRVGRLRTDLVGQSSVNLGEGAAVCGRVL